MESNFRAKMDLKLTEYETKAPDPENRCGGIMHCKNRMYDSTKDDCQECLDYANEAVVNAGVHSWD